MVYQNTILIFFVFISGTLDAFNFENLDDYKRINFAETPPPSFMNSTESILLKSYWLSIQGKHKHSLRLLTSCKNKPSLSPEGIYYCHLIEANNAFWLSDYQSMSRALKYISNSQSLSSFLSDKQIQNIKNYADIIDKTKLIANKEWITTKVENDSLYTEIDLETEQINFIVDTGAVVGAYSKCNQGKGEINSLTSTGKEVTSTQCLLHFGENTALPTLTSNNMDIIGQLYLSAFRGIKILDVAEVHAQSLFKDQHLLFFKADVKLGSDVIENTNICLDTGARKSIIAPKLYRKIRELLKAKKISQMSISTPFGQQKALVKVVPEIFIILSDGSFMHIENLPAFFNNSSFNPCDLVLGSETIINNISRIDFRESTIYFFKK